MLAALLATVGLYGVVAHNIARRAHEIGVRLALGADGTKIARMVVGEALSLVAIGVGIGLVLALAATPVTLVVAIGLLGAIAVVASPWPALRAARVDPMVALREE